MISERKLKANRQNALASTGPCTTVGKRKASCNALRHGLASSIWTDPDLAAEADKLTHQLVGPKAGIELLTCARSLAAAHVDLLRIRRGAG